MTGAVSTIGSMVQAYVPAVTDPKAPTTAVSTAKIAATTAQPAADTAQISDQAKALGVLFDQASKLVQAGHVEPFTGYDHGQLSTGAVINVRKYNDYLFGKAADTVVGGAAQQGVTLDKDEVIAQLKDANKSIAGLDQSQADRNAALGSGSGLTRLSQTDVDKATDMYIAAQEKGLSYDPTLVSGLKGAFSLDNYTGAPIKLVSTEDYLKRYGNDHSAETVARANQELPDLNVSQDTGKDDPRQALLDLTSSQVSALSTKYGIDQKFLTSFRMLSRSSATDSIANFLAGLVKAPNAIG